MCYKPLFEHLIVLSVNLAITNTWWIATTKYPNRYYNKKVYLDARYKWLSRVYSPATEAIPAAAKLSVERSPTNQVSPVQNPDLLKNLKTEEPATGEADKSWWLWSLAGYKKDCNPVSVHGRASNYFSTQL